MAGDFRSRILPDAVARWGPPGSSGMVTYPVWRGGKRLRLGATGLRRFWRSAHPSQPDPSAGSKNGGLEQRVREQTEELEELRVALATSRGEMNALATVKAKELEEVWAHAHKLDAALQRLNTIFWSTKYHADGLAVWDKDTTFLSDPAFVAAYQLGMNSGHKIGRESGSTDDIHIEWRVHVVCWAAWHATHLEGSFVECGVNTGIYSLAVCQFIDFNATGKDFFLFDTFSGIPEEQMSLLERKDRILENTERYEECFAIARRNFERFPRARLIRGTVPDTLVTTDIDKVCYLSIDMNIVKPELAAIEFFWDKLVPGALVVLDDYGWSPHVLQQQAMDEFADRKGIKILHLPTGQGLIVKP